jgi:hypothetical protein
MVKILRNKDRETERERERGRGKKSEKEKEDGNFPTNHWAAAPLELDCS